MTRHPKKLKEGKMEVQKPTEIAKAPKEVVYLSSPRGKHIANRTKRGKEEMTEKIEFQHLEEKLRLEN